MVSITDPPVIGDEIVCCECLTCRHRTWFQRSEYGLTSMALLRRKLRCTQCGSTAVRMERPQYIDPENLTYVVMVQYLSTQKPEVFVRANNITVARAAFEAACREMPRQRIYLAHGMRIIVDSRSLPPEAAE